MLTLESWLPHAERLKQGAWARVDHDCGGGRTLRVSHDVGGYSAWCFRCSDKGWAPGPQLSQAEKLAAIRAARSADDEARSVSLPQPLIRDPGEWSEHCRLWMYKAGLGRDSIGRLGAAYHLPTDRVVIPVMDGGKLAFWQARAIGRQPKYLSPPTRPPSLIARWGGAADVTVTEDILSAFKVAESGGEGWAIMGTHIPDAYVAALVKRGGRVNIWTDSDAAGRRSAAKYLKTLRAYGLDVRNIVTDRDPKLIPRSKIKELLL